MSRRRRKAAAKDSGLGKRNGAAPNDQQIWEEREKRLEELLEKDGGPNPKTKEDFNRLLKEMVRGSKEA